MLPITLGASSFKFGPWDIPYDHVSGAGVAVQTRRSGVYRSLIIAYHLPGETKVRRIHFGLGRGSDLTSFVESFRAHVADRWQGEAGLFEMRKRLGLSNRFVFGLVAAIVVLTVVGVIVALAMSPKPARELPPRAGSPSQAPRR
jgi:hypothetical protein